MSKNIGIVVQRFGSEIMGGAEIHAAKLAYILSRKGRYKVTILTTTSSDHQNWRNTYSEGLYQETENISVLRFKVSPKISILFSIFKRIHKYVISNLFDKKSMVNVLSEKIWFRLQGPYSKGLLDHIKNSSSQYDGIIFFTYLYHPTINGLKLAECRKYLIPTAHDEEPLYFQTIKLLFQEADEIFANSEEEKSLIERSFPGTRSKTSVIGIPVRDYLNEIPNASKTIESGPFALYIGRISKGKSVDMLIDYFSRWRVKSNSNLVLILAGQSDNSISLDKLPSFIQYVGKIDDERKGQLLRQAKLAINPSKFESLSLIALESIMAKKILLVNSKSDVLLKYSKLYENVFSFQNFKEFEEKMNALLTDNLSINFEKSRNDIENEYGEDQVFGKLHNFLEQR